MATGLELALLAVVVLALVGVYKLIKNVKALAVNAVVGLVVLVLADVLGFGVAITPVIVLIVAFGGFPGAVLVLILAHLDVMFEPLVLLPF
jgi:hypothetical protein